MQTSLTPSAPTPLTSKSGTSSLRVLTQASRQWASRPHDERFVSLIDLEKAVTAHHEASRTGVIASKAMEFMPSETDPDDIQVVARRGSSKTATMTHWAFGQMAALAGAPAAYLRNLPVPLAADCLTYGMRFDRSMSDVGIMSRSVTSASASASVIQAATGPNYGRVWNSQVVSALTKRFGDGVTGDWRVPGEYGPRARGTVPSLTSTTLYASDRDMFVFLADENRRVTIPNRRDGKTGGLARGFFVWNSEVGSTTLGVAMFLFDYACANRIVWGAEQYKEIKIRHTASAPDRFVSEIAPVLRTMAESSPRPIESTLKAAQDMRIRDQASDLDTWLRNRKFSVSEIAIMSNAFLADENRPLDSPHASLWDVVTAATAAARNIPYQNERVALERRAGALLDLVTA